MELEELKESWIALDNRLKRNEELKESIILEMMKNKTGKTVNRFIIWEIIAVVVLLLMIPLLIFECEKMSGRNWARDIILLFTVVVCFVYPFWGVFKLHGLMKIDLSKNVRNNIYYVNRYRIQLNREKKILYYFLGPVFVVLGILTYAVRKVTFPWWCVFIATG